MRSDRRNRDPLVAISSLGLIAIAGACTQSPSAESLRTEFQSYVAGANQCSDSSECTFVSLPCPLGCFAAVRSDRKDDVNREAELLVSRYEGGAQGCSYDCAAPTGLVCLAGRCAEGNGAGGGASGGPGGLGGGAGAGDGGGAGGGPGGGPIPSAYVSFTPSDGATATQGMDLALAVSDPGNVATTSALEALRASVTLVTWPDRGVVPATVTVPGAGDAARTRLLVTPAAALGAGWYALLLPSLGAPFVAADVLPDGTAGVRFRPTSMPRVRALDVCEKDPPGSKLLVQFSEPVDYLAPAAGLVSLAIDGAASPCDVYDARPDGLYLACSALTATSRATVSIAAGIEGASHVALAPATFDLDVAALPAGSCRELVTPIP